MSTATGRHTASTLLRGYSILNQGWTMTMEPGEPIVFSNPKFGELAIGMHPSGKFDQPLFHEIGGGGVMAVGYARFGGELHVMVLKAPRPNYIGDEDMPDIEVPGGFFNGREAALAGAARELIEETGVVPSLEPVEGRHFAGNRAFFVIDGEDEGTRVFTFELSEVQIPLVEADNRLQLMPWRAAIRQTRDALSGMAIARVVAELL
jgi:8-oxo-dGTP pyrophosphatase MutT (NUDIX family)